MDVQYMPGTSKKALKTVADFQRAKKVLADIQYSPQTSKKAVSHQKRLSVVKKGCRSDRLQLQESNLCGNLDMKLLITTAVHWHLQMHNSCSTYSDHSTVEILCCLAGQQTSCAVNRSSSSKLFLLQNFMNIDETNMNFFLVPATFCRASEARTQSRT